MAKGIMFLFFSLLLLVTVPAQAGGQGMKARADLVDPTGKTVGAATLTEQRGGVRVELKVWNLPPGAHGFHIHEHGTCTPPDFKSAGGHFNPFSRQHGAKNPQGKHAGDLNNLEVKQDGKGEATVVATRTTLGKGPGSLLKEGGTSIVIHADPDDYMSDPAGNAGARVACGAVVKEK